MELIYLADRFFNVKPRTRSGKALALLDTSLYFKRNVASLALAYKQLRVSTENTSVISVEKYTGNNSHVKALADKLEPLVPSFIKGVYVHGSLGTSEEVLYSDFDALIILSDEVFKSESAMVLMAQQLFNASQFFFQFDPLQHHRWFVIPEKCLLNYPETFFPVELFRYSKSLFNAGTELSVSLTENADFKKPFYNLSNSIIKNIEMENFPTHMYSLKSLLSEFMLLPSFYVQARDHKGVFKKFSFDAAKKDFTPAEWKIMDEVSHIRNIWHYDVSENEIKELSKHDYRSRQKIKRKSVLVPVDILMFLTNDFYQRMKLLALQMQKKLVLK